MENTILDRAEELGYEIIETTSEGNGYPSNLKKAIIGFEDFEDAESFASKYGLRVEKFYRKAGWQLWVRGNNTAYKAYDMAEVYRDEPCHSLYFCGDEELFTDNVKEQIAELNDFELIQAVVVKKSKIWDEFCTLGEDEFILVYEDELDCVMERYRMAYEYDSTYYRIGVI